MKITVIGTGYVGLVSGACLAEVGNHVLCLDTDLEKIALLKSGEIPIFEPGLSDLVARNIAAGRLIFSTDIVEAAQFGRVQFIAVGTPPDEDGSADLKHVLAAARNIGRHINAHTVIVDKSTVPVGTGDKVTRCIQQELDERRSDLSFSVVSNPEFLKEGAAIEDFMRPDRIVVGCSDDVAIETMRELYAPFQRNHNRLIVMDVKSAELTKYAANAMLATRISFMNELAAVADALGADIEHVRKGIGSDSRIGYDFLYAGCGYGGSCFPKDVKALIKTAKDDAGLDLQILSAVESSNNAQKHVLGKKIKTYFSDEHDSDIKGKRFAVWGLAFKPNTDDMREAPSLYLINDLLDAGASVCAYDPVAIPHARQLFENTKNICFASDPMQALDGADALVIVTEWKEFKAPDFAAVKSRLKTPVIFDGRNLYAPEHVRQAGLKYLAIGRRS